MPAPLPCLAFWLLLGAWASEGTVLAAPDMLETLHYQLAVLAWQDAARLRVSLKNPGPGRYEAEAVGETRGFIKLVSGDRRERLYTEMIWRDQRLRPLVYREESWRSGKHREKEYRFDYPRNRLEMWQATDGEALAPKWQTALPEPVYDPLSAFYNCRLGILGPTREGETASIPGIPYPRPEVMEVRLGGETPQGRSAMVSLMNAVFADSRGQVFGLVDNRLVPRRAWTTVFGIKVTGVLLPDSVLLPPDLKALPGAEPEP